MRTPIKTEPDWRTIDDGRTYFDNAGSKRLSHLPSAYAAGFEDGAFALAERLWEMASKNDREKLIETLHEYHAGRAHPVAGWQHAPARH
jgi:hypothetical protein